MVYPKQKKNERIYVSDKYLSRKYEWNNQIETNRLRKRP